MPIETDGKPNAPKPVSLGGSLLTLLTFLILFNLLFAPGLRSPRAEVLYSQFRQDGGGKSSSRIGWTKPNSVLPQD
jgi:hypothetical protein